MPPSLEAVHRLFVAACELAGDERAAYLRRACGGDAELRAAVEALFAEDARSELFAEGRLDLVRNHLGGDAAPMPARMGEFEVLEVLGKGGMGVVYRGRQSNPARDVAIKVLAPGCGGKEARARFALEATALARLQHPGIAQIHAAGTWHSPHGEQPFLAMELVRGEPLHRWAKHTRPDTAAALAVLLQIGDALQHAHQRGLIHRDLKPGNVVVDDQGRAKVLDFGIARLLDDDREATLRTHTGEVLGTLAYMSPEQANGTADVDVRTDVYAAGVLGYELLTGALPIAVDAGSLTANLRRLAEVEARPLGSHGKQFAGDLETIFGKALRKEPAQRYATMQAFTDDLRRFLAHEPIAARPASFGYLAARFARRHRGLVAGTAVAVLALLGGTTASVLWALRADAEATRATRAEGLAVANESKALAAEKDAIAAAQTARTAQAAAQAEAQLAESVTKFVEELFSQAAPEIAQGRAMTVVDLVRRGGTMVQEGLGDQPVRRARLARLLGTVLSEMGDHKAALPLAETATTTLAAQLPADDPRLLEAMLTLAACRFTASDIAGAEPLFADVLARHERAGRGRDSGQFARAHEGLGACASLRRDLDKALTHYTTMQEARAADPSPDVRGLDLMRLGVVHTQRGDEAAADAALVAAYELLRTGKNQVAAAQLASNLGILRLRQGRPDDAEPLFAEALAIGDRTLGPEHPYQMRRLCNLAGLYSQRGRLDDAEPLLRRALAIAERAETGQGDVTANVLMNLGNVRSARGAHTEALDLYRRAAALYEAASGPRSPDLADALENMAIAHEALGQANEAKALRDRVARIRGR